MWNTVYALERASFIVNLTILYSIVSRKTKSGMTRNGDS